MNEYIDEYKLAFEAMAANAALLKADTANGTILAITDNFVETIGYIRADFANKELLSVYDFYINEVDAREQLKESLEHVIKNKAPQELLLKPKEFVGTTKGFAKRLWTVCNKPVLSKNGEVKYIIHSVIELAEQFHTKEKNDTVQLTNHTQQLFTQAPVAVCILKGDDHIIALANDKMLEIWGRDSSVVGKPVIVALPEIEGTPFPKLLDDVINNGESYRADESHLHLVRNGVEELVNFNFVYQPYYEQENEPPTGVLVVANEVTEQVLSKRKAEESEQLYRNLIAQASVATGVYIGKEMRILSANDAMIKLWGKDLSVIGKTLKEALPELDGQLFFGLLDKVFTTGETYWGKDDKGEIVVDGKLQTFYFNYTYKALRNAEGEVYGILNMAIDVTDQVLATKKIEEAEEHLRLAIEASEQGSFEVDLLTDHLVASPKMAQVFGVELDADRTRYINAIYPEDIDVRKAAYDRSYETGVLDYDGRVRWKDNSVHWIRVKGKTYFDEQRNPIRVIGVVQDITEQKEFSETLRKKVEERTKDLEESNKNLETINKELEQFTYAASHDMQEPLRKVQTFSSILLQKYADQLDDKARTYVEKISSSVQRMKTIIFDLLNYSYQVNEQPFFIETDLNKIIEDIESDLELRISQQHATVLKDQIPLIAAIPGQMNQLFYNLFSNALKFAKPNNAVNITISCKEATHDELSAHSLNTDTSFIKITFEDNGIGFDQEFAVYIFSLFKRLHGKDAYEGTGIGLGLCKKIVEFHKGAIWATSAPSKGAIFHILLPV